MPKAQVTSLQARTKSAVLSAQKKKPSGASGGQYKTITTTPTKQGSSAKKTPAKPVSTCPPNVNTPKTPANTRAASDDNMQDEEAVKGSVTRYRRYQKANRVIIIGQNPVISYEKLIADLNIVNKLIYGVQMVEDSPYLLAYVYFRKSSFAADYVNSFHKPDCFAFRQTVKTSFRYKVCGHFLCYT